MRLLIVKTSSMGDVVHATPVVADICRQHPGAVIDWLVEAPFAAIPQLHPGVRRVWPMAWRKWRGQLLQAATWRTMRTLRDDLRDQRYELVLDLQGLLKSALWARQAAAPVAGYDRDSLREPLAARFYQRTAAVPRHLHAVQRCRRLAAAHLGYAVPDSAPDFGLRAPTGGWAPRGAYAGADSQRQPAREARGPSGTGWPWGAALSNSAGPRWCCGAGPRSRPWPSASPPVAKAMSRPS